MSISLPNYTKNTLMILFFFLVVSCNEKVDKSDKYIIDYYSLFTWKHWYLLKPYMDKNEWGKFTMALLCNIFILPLFYLILLVTVLISSLTMFTISATLFAITTFFKLFFYPIANSLEFYNIVKSHSTVLTIFFCILVFVSATTSLASETRNIMAFVLAMIILGKLIQSTKK